MTPHDHSPGHGHSHAPAQFERAFYVGISLNILFVIVETFYGFQSHSLALLADAGHNLSDVLGLGLAWGASFLATRKANSRFSYGYKSSTIVASFLNAILLLAAVGGILVEAIQRLLQPENFDGHTVMGVATLGIAINGATALMFASGRHSDLNIRGAFMHMASDALVSLGVVIAGALSLYFGWLWIDPGVSLLISGVIIWGTWGLFMESLKLSLHAVPTQINLDEVKTFLESQPGVKQVHDLHIWAMSTTEIALTCHLVVSKSTTLFSIPSISALSESLQTSFGIEHSTIQLDTENGECSLQSDH